MSTIGAITMNINKIDDTCSVAAQIHPDDIGPIVAAGFKSIICNRPDGESADQVSYAEIEVAAQAAGVPIRYIPVISGGLTMNDVTAMQVALEELPKPIFAYCRSGARSGNLYNLALQHSA
jgi:uncharacterized protein (TIGR01244 family)